MTASQPTFLGLPLEVRQIIYDLCYLEPFSGSIHEPTLITGSESESEPASKQKNKKRRLHKQDNVTVRQLRGIATKCLFPECHLSLASVSRQIRNEYFPVFAAHHIFSFSDPLVFANEYLSYTPPHRYSNIRHLALHWNAAGKTCQCEVVGECRTHISGARNVNHDMRNLISLVNIYPELFSNVESIQFDLQPFYSGSTSGNRIDLFRNAVLLLEEIDQLNETVDGEQRKYLVVPHSTSGSYTGLTRLNIFVVSNDTWAKSTDGATLFSKDCKECQTGPAVLLPPPRRCNRHGIDWKDIDQFVSALQEGKFHQQKPLPPSELDIPYTYFNGEKNWKVLFDKASSLTTAWEHAMRDLSVWKGTNQRPKQQGRKRKFVS